MKNKTLIALLVLFGLGLAACGGDQAVKPVTEGATEQPAETTGAAPQTGADSRALDSQAGLLGKRRVYFAFDSSAIDSDSRAVIEAHAAHLVANPGTKLVLEGHADERGTREYNLALGERRAQAVERMMRTLGVAANRIKTTSYGEEKPVALDHNESAWQLNRRVEIIY